VLLRLTDAEFLELTPHQFYVLIDTYAEMVEHQEFLTGLIAATVANWSFHAPKKQLTPNDMLGRGNDDKEPSERGKRDPINRKQVERDVRAWVDELRKQPNSPIVTVNPKAEG
jgi:hypothetical protein